MSSLLLLLLVLCHAGFLFLNRSSVAGDGERLLLLELVVGGRGRVQALVSRLELASERLVESAQTGNGPAETGLNQVESVLPFFRRGPDEVEALWDAYDQLHWPWLASFALTLGETASSVIGFSRATTLHWTATPKSLVVDFIATVTRRSLSWSCRGIFEPIRVKTVSPSGVLAHEDEVVEVAFEALLGLLQSVVVRAEAADELVAVVADQVSEGDKLLRVRVAGVVLDDVLKELLELPVAGRRAVERLHCADCWSDHYGGRVWVVGRTAGVGVLLFEQLRGLADEVIGVHGFS
ncbi:hypothetical protein TYRP_020534 [Tyrophagus putrescentiae]|nr:hypothetical protein TYRP_020534 [Tyrophagus putrescentiae]